MNEQDARRKILANGFKIERETSITITVAEPRGRRSKRTWTGVNFKDLAQTFKLHQRKAGE